MNEQKLYKNETDFQTSHHICQYMASFIVDEYSVILEPTEGKGNLSKVLSEKGKVIAPKDFFKHKLTWYDYIVMNPPFTPMKLGYDILFTCMNHSDNIIALMPWLTIINSEKRTNSIIEWGLKSITHLPRNAFNGSRVQTCILEMRRGHQSGTRFYHYKQGQIINKAATA